MQGPVTRLGVFAVALRPGPEVLLVHQAGSGRWTLPGGGVHFGEPPEAALARELREETGLALVSARILGTHDNVYDAGDGVRRHGVRLLYAVEVEASEGWEPGTEIDEVAWFAIDDLPPGTTPWAHEGVRVAG